MSQRWGWLAEFESAAALRSAIDSLSDEERTAMRLEAYTPFPVDGLAEALRYRRSPVPWIIMAGGVLGGSSIFALEWWINLIAYPLNIGGRPLFSWPSFVPPAFEGTVLGASFFAIFGLMWACGLPRLHHPVFEVEAFKRASTDGFFLAVHAVDEDYRTRLTEIGALDVWEVPNV